MKSYVILHAQHIPPFGMGLADVEFVCSSLAIAMSQMNKIVNLLNEGKLFSSDKPYEHKLIIDETITGSRDGLFRQIVIEHWLYGVKQSTTYYRLVVKNVNEGLIE